MTSNRREVVLAISSTLGLGPALLATGAPASAAVQGGKKSITVGISQEITSLHPLMIANNVNDNAWCNLFSSLWQVQPDGNYRPMLAMELPTSANGGISADGLTWTVKLRKDVKWHDGNDFTSSDVRHSLELLKNPAFKAFGRSGHALVRDIKTPDAYTITWRMEEPFAPYVAVLASTYIVPAHILSKVADPNDPKFAAAPIGTGPYRFGERKTGDFLRLIANNDFFGGRPSIETLIFKFIPDQNAMYTQFRTGDIDITAQQFIPANFYEEAKTIPGRKVVVFEDGSTEILTLNLKHPVLADKAVRQALYAGIDKQAIRDSVYYGIPRPAEGYVPVSNWSYNKGITPHKYDLNRAKSVLDAAGWLPGPDGVRVKGNVRLEFTSSTVTGSELRAQVQQLIAEDWKKLGVSMKISNLPGAVLFSDFILQSKFDNIMSSMQFLTNSDPDVSRRFASTAIPAEKAGAGLNFYQFKNPEMDVLLKRGLIVSGRTERKAIYDRVQDIVREELPLMPLFYTTNIVGMNSRLSGFIVNPNAPIVWNAYTWKWI